MHRKKKNIIARIMIAIAASAVVLLALAVWQGLNYSPDGNTHGATNMAIPGVAGVVLLLILAAMIMAQGAGFSRKAMTDAGMTKTMTDTGMTKAEWYAVQFAVMETAHLAWRDHNRRTDARLTESVMGKPRPMTSWDKTGT